LITFGTITLKNFLSYGAVPISVNLDRRGTSLIVGEDLDNTTLGVGANGSGKTSIINALVYALYDKPLSNISKDNLVNNINKKNMEVSLTFSKDNDSYHITRARKSKGKTSGNWVKLIKNGRDVTPDSVSNTNDLIESIIGLPFDLFIRIVAISATHTPFLDLPVRAASQANQTDFIEELFDLKTLSEKAVSLKSEIKEADTSRKLHQVRIDGLEKEHNRHEKQLESAQRRVDAWEKTNKTEIRQIQQNLERVDGVDVDAQHTFINQLAATNNQLTETQGVQRSLQRKIASETKAKTEAEEEIHHLNDDKCPYCLQDFLNKDDKIAEKQTIIDSTSAAIADLTEAVNDVDEQINTLTVSANETQQLIVVTNIDELIEIKGRSAGYDKELQTLQNATNPFIEPLKELQDIKLDPIDMDKINTLSTLIDHQKFLLKLLTKKDSFVRKALLNKNIPFLNQRLAYYLAEIGLPHTVEFTHEMTAHITQFGRPLDFGNLSNGQQARVNLALSFAFRDVLQSMHTRINVCMLDEVLDVGLDAVGVHVAASMLKRKAREDDISLYVISHRDEIDGVFDHKITVQMSKGFSYIDDSSTQGNT